MASTKNEKLINCLVPCLKHMEQVQKQLETDDTLIKLADALPKLGSGYMALKVFKLTKKATQKWNELKEILDELNDNSDTLIEETRMRINETYDENAEEDELAKKADRDAILEERYMESLMTQNPDPYSPERDQDLDLEAEFELQKFGFKPQKDGYWTGQFAVGDYVDAKDPIVICEDDDGIVVYYDNANPQELKVSKPIHVIYDEEEGISVYHHSGEVPRKLQIFAKKYGFAIHDEVYHNNKLHKRLNGE
jgi:hypothetical protein